MTIEELKVRLAELDASLAAVNDERDTVRNEIARLSTTFKVGDRVTWEGCKATYQIMAIRPGWSSTPKIMGAKIKKDGTPGAVVGEIPAWKPIKLVDA